MKTWFGAKIVLFPTDWKRADEAARGLNGAILCAILLMLALGAGRFGYNSQAVGIHLVVHVTTNGVQSAGKFWRNP